MDPICRSSSRGSKGFEKIVVDADLQPAHAVPRFAARCQHQDRHLRALTQIGGKVEAVLPGHHDVEYDDVEGQSVEEAPRFDRVRGDRHAMAVLGQIGRQQIPQPPVVVDDQHMRGVVSRRGRGHDWDSPWMVGGAAPLAMTLRIDHRGEKLGGRPSP